MRRGRVAVPEITEDHLAAAQSVRARHRALDLDLADAVNVALAADYGTDAVLTLDRRGFRADRRRPPGQKSVEPHSRVPLPCSRPQSPRRGHAVVHRVRSLER
nr:PIN domain-containing protein [Streptomyces hoynatensis]